MAKQINPFHSWLGIDERLGVPTHYQLFGVKPKFDDLDEFRKQVEQNYRSLAAKLDGMSAAEIGSHQKLHARLVAHVAKAHKTLLDDQLRTSYLNSLRNKVRQKKAARTEASKMSSSKEKRDVAAKSRTETQASKTFKQSSMGTIKQSRVESVAKQAVETPAKNAAIPMALPVAKSATVPTARPTATPVNTRETASANHHKEAMIVAEIDQLESQARSEAIMIRSLRSQRKKSYLMPILIAAIGMLVFAGLYGLISGSDYQLSLSGTPEEQSNDSADEIPLEVTSESAPAQHLEMAEGSVAEGRDTRDDIADSSGTRAPREASAPAGASDSLREDDVEPNPSAAMGAAEMDSMPESVEPLDAGTLVLEPAASDTDSVDRPMEPDSGLVLTEDHSGASESMEETATPAMKEVPDPEFLSAEEGSFAAAGFFVGRARSEMKRGRVDSAREQLRLAEKLIGGATGKNSVAVSEAISDGQSVAGVLDGFWSQVVSSGRSYEGINLQPAPGTIVGFVEGRESDVVVKIGGETFAVPYRSLRPGLAMELASKGAVSDVSRWGLQQAAFRIVHASGSAKSTQAIEALLSEAESAGLSTDPLRRFWENDLLGNESVDKLPYEPKSLKPIVKKLVSGKYSSIRRLAPERAQANAIDLASAQYEDALTRAAALGESAKLAARAGDAGLMLDLVDELDAIADIEAGMMKAEGFHSMAKRLPAGANARVVADAFYEYVRSRHAKEMNRNQLQKVKISMLDFVTENQMTDLKRLISQSME